MKRSEDKLITARVWAAKRKVEEEQKLLTPLVSLYQEEQGQDILCRPAKYLFMFICILGRWEP